MISCDSVRVLRNDRRLLDKVSLNVSPGEVMALIGPNGAGKSTLLKTLSYDIRPDRGSVRVNRCKLRCLSHRDRAKQIAVLPQAPDASRLLRARDVVSLGVQLTWGKVREDAVYEALDDVGALRLAERPMGFLSGGERQRVHLARVMAQARRNPNAQVVLLDEPCSAQDPGHLGIVLQAIRTLGERHAVVVVMHDLHAASAIASKVCLLSQGKVARSGTPADVFQADLLSRMYGAPFQAIHSPDKSLPVVLPKLHTEFS